MLAICAYYGDIRLNAFATYYAHDYASIIGSSLIHAHQVFNVYIITYLYNGRVALLTIATYIDMSPCQHVVNTTFHYNLTVVNTCTAYAVYVNSFSSIKIIYL